MEFIDYYKILDITKSATEAEIKKAYRKLARKYHPDLNPNDKEAEKKFKAVNEANEVLSNADNRKKYDEYGKDWKHAEQFEAQKRQQQAQGQYRNTGSFRGFSEEDFSGGDFSDFFESMFGGQASGGRSAYGQRRTGGFRGQDFNAELQLNLKDIFETEKRVLTVNGKNIRLTIPAGVEDGQVIKIKGKGGQGMNGGPSGDLLIQFNILNNTKFKRDGANLYSTEIIDLYTALLGGEVTVSIFDGKVKLTVKPETQNGTKVKLKGKGFPVYKKEGQFGDLFITYEIKMPSNLSAKEKELFNELKNLNS